MNQSDFILLISPFQDKLFRMAKRLLVSHEEAQDAVQEVLLKLWNKRSDLERYNSVEALAVTMVKNFCLDQLQAKRSGNLKIVHTNFTDREAPLHQQVEDRNSWEWMQRAIEKLPEQQRMIVQLRDIEQCEYDKIAEILEMNETAVRVALSRARKTLREFITKTHSYGIA